MLPDVKMADSVLEVVEKLQSRLSANAEPRKLHKTLKRLAELPITVDILVETGVGKTVNSLRKHEVVGEFAKSLVAQWKKLVPQDVPRAAEPEERECHKSTAKKRPRDPSPKEDYDEDEMEYEEALQSYHQRDERHRPMGGYRKEENRYQRYSEQEDSDDGQTYSPQPIHSPVNIYRDRTMHKPEKEQKSSHKEKHQHEVKSVEPERKKEKSSSKEMHRDHSSLAGSSKEKSSPESKEQVGKKEKNKHSGSRSHGDDLMDNKKQKHPEKSKPEKPKLSVDMQTVEKAKKSIERDEEPPARDKVDKNKVKSKTGEQVPQEKKSIKISMPSTDKEIEDEYEKPQMSFESYLSYDQPKKKKKPTVKPSTTTPNKSSKKPNENRPESTSKETTKRTSEPAVKNKLKRAQKATTHSKVKIEQVPVLPDIPLPMIQPNYRPLPSIEPVIFSPAKRKAPLLSVQEDEEAAGFTGRRLNSKMQVYSGSKTAYLPKMMSLYQQCIRVLSNNIDSIYEVGGVPFSVLEPVLEKCTPDQLYRIEECNHVLIEDTDRLWMNHCQRDFKNEKAEEFESWREMYLRLHEAREQRLLMLTQNIRSAHANKPRGRTAKMAFVNSAVKPPRDVRRRQEKFGTGAAAVPEKARFKPFTPISSSSSSASASASTSSNNHVSPEEPRSYEGPSTSSTPSSSTPSSVQHGHNPRKPQVKKVAPMMAKTIQAFKNRFSRR